MFGPDEFQELSGVSRETLARLKLFVDLLQDWNSRLNLVSAASLQDVWQRHVWDSTQLAALIPKSAKSLADLGSGAGFPGLVLALVLAERGEFRTVLFEATAKKCHFLAEAAERTGARVEIQNVRMEDVPLKPFDVVTARACAPLNRLLPYAQRFAGSRTVCLFLKGQSVGVELTEARKSWNMRAVRHPSRSNPSGTILEIRELRHVARTRRP